jgi:hypothetical protein
MPETKVFANWDPPAVAAVAVVAAALAVAGFKDPIVWALTPPTTPATATLVQLKLD